MLGTWQIFAHGGSAVPTSLVHIWYKEIICDVANYLEGMRADNKLLGARTGGMRT